MKTVTEYPVSSVQLKLNVKKSYCIIKKKRRRKRERDQNKRICLKIYYNKNKNHLAYSSVKAYFLEIQNALMFLKMFLI